MTLKKFSPVFAFLMMLFLLGCGPRYTQAPKVSGNIYSYGNNKPLKNIPIGNVKTDENGSFALPDSDTDGEPGFEVSKKFTLNINTNEVQCQCNTIGPYDTSACNKAQFFLEPDQSALYYFNASSMYRYVGDSLWCHPLNKKLKVFRLQHKKKAFMIGVTKDGSGVDSTYFYIRREILLYFGYAREFKYIDAWTAYTETISEILEKLNKGVDIIDINGVKVSKISHSDVYSFFMEHEAEFENVFKEKLAKQELKNNPQLMFNVMRAKFYKTLESMKERQ